MSENNRWREYVARKILIIMLKDEGMLDGEAYLCLLKKLDSSYKDVLNADET